MQDPEKKHSREQSKCRLPTQIHDVRLSRDEAYGLLSRLCVDLGFCLPPDDLTRLCDNPPLEIPAFTEAVVRAEGFDPVLMDSKLYRAVQDKVCEAFKDSQERQANGVK